jgi:hypothetical protein
VKKAKHLIERRGREREGRIEVKTERRKREKEKK